MNMKLLSPAGDFDSLKQAVFNGADEVYLGVKNFNARNIEGFDLDLLKKAVLFAHIFGVKVHLTVNILFNDQELKQALDLIVDAYNIGVDAFIVQDIGLINLVKKYYPQIELHASTQMGVHNLEGVKQLEKLGIKRVVLARETDLDEIKRINKNSKLEIEYFVQGALCVSFSGNCYLSSYLEDASGNRGKCKQLCRLPYEMLYQNKKVASGFLLSAKDFCMLNNLKDLELSGVDAIKIEGRARRPYYVAVATKAYRAALDELGDVDLEELKLAFNRGFTAGYFDGNGNIISNAQGNVGIPLGKVLKVSVGKKFNEVEFETSYAISPKSAIKVFRKDLELCTVAPFDIKQDKNKVVFTTTANIKVGDRLNLILDYAKEQDILKFALKKKLKAKIVAKANQPILAVVSVGDKLIKVEGDICQTAQNRPLLKEELEQSFKRSEYFDFDLELALDKVFLTKSQLNAFRRKIIEVCEGCFEIKRELKKVDIANDYKINTLTNFKFIENINEVTSVNEHTLIFAPSDYNKQEILKFTELCKSYNKQAYLNTPMFATKQDIEFLNEILLDKRLGVVANNLYALNFSNKKIVGGGLNVYNSYSAKYFNLPVIIAENNDLGVLTKMPYTTMRHCPIKQFLGGTCAKCPYKDGYKYKMQSGKVFNLKRSKLKTCTFYLTD